MNTDGKPAQRTAANVLAEEFLASRARILDLAATLDRLERAQGNAEDAHAMGLFRQGLAILCDGEPEKAQRVQLLMSREYDPEWRKNYGLH